jgi:hypothetical protein
MHARVWITRVSGDRWMRSTLRHSCCHEYLPQCARTQRNPTEKWKWPRNGARRDMLHSLLPRQLEGPAQSIHNTVRGMYTCKDVHDDIAAVSKSMQFIANCSVR